MYSLVLLSRGVLSNAHVRLFILVIMLALCMFPSRELSDGYNDNDMEVIQIPVL